MATLVKTREQSPQESAKVTIIEATKIYSYEELQKLIDEKAKADLFRFRTCCADPRASM